MELILVAFVTGLTTGGLSCLAVQGGLLASSLANDLEKDVRRSDQALPILAFLLAKLFAYTVLGGLLGLLGQVFQLSTVARAVLQIGIGIFMLGSALRMLNVHPIFRYFAFEPPAGLRRMLRREAAVGAENPSLITPVFLGLLTVLIPCGVTQAMMAAALGTGSPLQGALLLFAFTLGASPVFFTVAYFATRIGKKLERNFTRLVALVILALAVITIDSGITLAGSPLSLTRLVNNAAAPQAAAARPDAGGVVTITVKNDGYAPRAVSAPAGAPFKLRLVSSGVTSCARSFVIPKLGVDRLLPSTGEAIIDVPAQQKGTQLAFSCSMGMYAGMIRFD